MHGTSMASPNAAGCISLLVSAAKAHGLPWSPHSIRRVLESTAYRRVTDEPFSTGHGLIQVRDAYQAMVGTAAEAAGGSTGTPTDTSTDHSMDLSTNLSTDRDRLVDVEFEVTLTSHGGGPGLYLRKAIDMVKPHTVSALGLGCVQTLRFLLRSSFL